MSTTYQGIFRYLDEKATNGQRREIVQACLRELDEERKTIRVVMARLRLQGDEHNYETQAGKDSRVLRSLLPETEGNGE